MSTKVSILIKSNKSDDPKKNIDKVKQYRNCYYDWKDADEDILNNELIDDKFRYHVENYIKPSETMFDMMFRNLADQTFKDFEILLVHRYPDEINKDVIKKWQKKLDIKLIQPKHTVWHDLGDGYSDFINNINSGLIWANGELVVSIADGSLYDKRYLGNVVKLYNRKLLGICPRKIYGVVPDYIPSDEKKFGPNSLEDNQLKSDTFNFEDYKKPVYLSEMYPNPEMKYFEPCYYWGYAIPFPLEGALGINGFDETYDGWLGPDDRDFGNRLFSTTPYRPVMMKGMIYAFRVRNHIIGTIRNSYFGTNELMKIIGQLSPPYNYLVANKSRPTDENLKEYEKAYIDVWGPTKLDKNYNNIKNVSTFDLKELRKIRDKEPKKCGKVIL
jgi:hypothetical protein